LATTSSIFNILTYNSESGQLYYTSSDEYQKILVIDEDVLVEKGQNI
jgi:hypothetical protein